MAADYHVGFARTDITPNEPLRLSGYASRNDPFSSIADRLHARAMVVSPGPGKRSLSESLVLVSIDSIVVTSPMTVEVANWLSEEYGIPRAQFAFSSTHSHAAPHLEGGLENLFREPLSPEEAATVRRYTEKLLASVKQTIREAVSRRLPARLEIGDGQTDVAINRRVLKDGTWTGFGEQPSGPVDQRVRVLLAIGENDTVLGGSYLYACHCTTLDGDEVSGDWAGLSATRLERIHPETVFLPIIGCGADANPNPRRTYELAEQHAAKLVDAVQSVVSSEDRSELTTFPTANFGYAGLAPEQPTAELIQQRLESNTPNERRWAEHMQRVKKEMGRLPESYPMPIHTWQFGDQLSWVFLGGEVVVDYQFLIEKELTTDETWVAAYTDDVFAYVASERMRSEGGYEVDFSMVYYLQPGRWQSGTQSLILRRTREIFAGQVTESEPLSADEALKSIRVPDDFEVELVASEALVQDPINLAFGLDGSVWVVEMADYPLGTNGGGRLKRLLDTDGDGVLDEAQIFLSNLDYPTSVMPWQDGALVISAPDIIFAADRNGDGEAEIRETWLTGVHPANPQHRASGFEIGLDGWLHFAAGDHTHQLESSKTGKAYDVRGCDVAWNPETGEIRTVSGTTQFIRSRDAFGNWFGNSNSHPIYQYVIEERYRQGQSVSGGVSQDLLDPPVAPPVYPRSQVVDRFNDLYALNRFTSACSSILCRVPGLGSDFETSGLICEPVHNLVARIQVSQDGSCMTAVRHPADDTYDFFTSTDPWCRPVRVINAPDGSVWIVDMVRKVIEHPEWIPTAWQQRINLRDGSQLGRIYRVYHRDHTPTRQWKIRNEADDLIQAMSSDNGSLRDQAMLQIRWLDEQTASKWKIQNRIRTLATEHPNAAVRASCLGTLASRQWLGETDVANALRDADPRVIRYVLTLGERFPSSSQISSAMLSVVDRDLGPPVDLQWILSSTKLPSLDATNALQQIARRSRGDAWIHRALSLVEDPEQALAVLQGILEELEQRGTIQPQEYSAVVADAGKLWSKVGDRSRNLLVQQFVRSRELNPDAALSCPDLVLLSLISRLDSKPKGIEKVLATAQARMLDDDAPEEERIVLVNLIGSGLASSENELEFAQQLLSAPAASTVKQSAIAAVRKLTLPGVSAMLLDHWPNLTPKEKQLACGTLLSRRGWAAELISALESADVPTSDLDPGTVQRLRSYHDRDLRSRCLAVFGKPTPRTQVVAAYLEQMPAPKLGESSQRLFAEHCAACHTSIEGKPMIGPPLENLAHWTIDQWVTAIMDPNQAVEPKYKQQMLLTDDDQLHVGLIQDQSGSDYVLAQSDGTQRAIPKANVVETRDGKMSLMPEGFEQKLTPHQLSQLLGWLRNQSPQKDASAEDSTTDNRQTLPTSLR